MSGQLTDVPAPSRVSRRWPQALRWTVWLLPLHAVLLVWATWKQQPNPSVEFAEWARFVSTDEFRWSHLVASIGGQTAGVVGTAALTVLLVLRGAPIGRSATGLMLHLVGSSLMLTGFGVAAFAQPAIGELHEGRPGLAAELYSAVYGPTTFIVLLAGLALFSFSTVPTGSALASTAGVPRVVGRMYTLAGPVFGVLGFLVGTFQTLGALALAAASAILAVLLDPGAGNPEE